MTTTVICEECGKIYHISSDKLEQLGDTEIKGRCHCGHVTTFSKPNASLPPSAAQPNDGEQTTAAYNSVEAASMAGQSASSEASFSAQTDPVGIATDSTTPKKSATEGKKRIGLRSKLFILFLLLPLLLISVFGYFSSRQTDNLTGYVTSESNKILNTMAKNDSVDKEQLIKAMSERVQYMAVQTRNLSLALLIGTLLIVGLIVSLYANRLTKNLQHLTDVADRISVGELDAEIQIISKDEIGSLADAISRMQDSLRLSIQRLRRRR